MIVVDPGHWNEQPLGPTPAATLPDPHIELWVDRKVTCQTIGCGAVLRLQGDDIVLVCDSWSHGGRCFSVLCPFCRLMTTMLLSPPVSPPVSPPDE